MNSVSRGWTLTVLLIATASMTAVAQDSIVTVGGNGTAGFFGDSGAATSAELNHPTGVAVDSARNIFVADRGNNCIRRIDGSTGIITTFRRR